MPDQSPVRVTWQSFGQHEGMEAYQAHLGRLVRSAVGPGVDVSVRRLPAARVAGKGFASAQAFEVPALLRSIAGAIDDGAEAVAIGNGFDPGLWEARELFDVPILGLFETLVGSAMRAGWKIGVLCSGASGPARIEELATRYGVGGRLVRPVAAGISVPEIMAAFEDPTRAASLAADASRAVDVLADRGAEVVIVASGAFDVFLAAGAAGFAPSVPVLPAVPILAAELATAARLARAGVPFVGRVGRFRQPPQAVREALLD